MRIKILFFLIFSLFVSSLLKAQEKICQDTSIYNKVIIQDYRVDSLLMLHQKAMKSYLENEEHDGITGYRVQIYSKSGNNSRNSAVYKKEQFDRRYKNVPSYINFSQPNFYVKVGDFRTKLEAEALLNKIIRRYRGAYVTKSKIKFPALLY